MKTNYLEHDVQSETEGFEKLHIRKVGVRKIKLPLTIPAREKQYTKNFNTIAHVSAYCDLDKDKKGINMSRNSRVLLRELQNKVVYLDDFEEAVKELSIAHETNNIYLKVWFEYLYLYKSPITEIPSQEPAIVVFEIQYREGKIRKYLQVISNESSCCPCSKDMSMLKNNLNQNELSTLADKLPLDLYSKVIKAGYGAHNQRSEIDIKVELDKEQEFGTMWIEDIVDIAKKASSSETFNVLKREDEKYVTECQYMGGYYDEHGKFNHVEMSGPKFVEDIARDCAKLLYKELDKRIKDFIVVVNNDESIHSTLLATAIIDANRELK